MERSLGLGLESKKYSFRVVGSRNLIKTYLNITLSNLFQSSLSYMIFKKDQFDFLDFYKIYKIFQRTQKKSKTLFIGFLFKNKGFFLKIRVNSLKNSIFMFD